MDSSTRSAFAARFRQALKEAGYEKTPVRELAQFFGVSPQAVRKWASGESLISSSRAGEIAGFLKVRRAWLVDGELPIRLISASVRDKDLRDYRIDQPVLAISDSEYQLLQNFRCLPGSVQDAVLTIVEEGKKLAASR